MGCGKPAWLEALYTQKFFVNCKIHESAKKNEKNVLCLDCSVSICPHCLPIHRSHRLLQIRRYVYHDVIRLQDLDMVFDCSSVQAYTINSAKVIFIKKRPQNRQFKAAGNYCTSCDRSLQEPFIHCSLACKVEFVLTHNGDVSPYLRTCKVLELSQDYMYPQEEMMMRNETPHSSIVDCDEPMSSTSASSSSGSENMSVTCNHNININNNNNIVVRSKKTSSGLYVSDEDMATSMRRRKRIPHRSPLS